jgi:hypothetical protein
VKRRKNNIVIKKEKLKMIVNGMSKRIGGFSFHVA